MVALNKAFTNVPVELFEIKPTDLNSSCDSAEESRVQWRSRLRVATHLSP